MKHIFTNSNESAVVRNGYRCAKVARPLRTVFLIGTLLLTLGVGQMWAEQMCDLVSSGDVNQRMPNYEAGYNMGSINVWFSINGASYSSKSSSASDINSNRAISASNITSGLKFNTFSVPVYCHNQNHSDACSNNGARIVDQSLVMSWKVSNPSGTQVGSGDFITTTNVSLSWSGNGATGTWTSNTSAKDLLSGVTASTTGNLTYTMDFWYKFCCHMYNSGGSDWGSNVNVWYPGNSQNFKYQFTIPQTTLTVNHSGDDGTATASSGISSSIALNTNYTLTASEVTGYDFVNWTTSDASITITSAASRTGAKVKFTSFTSATITANYTPKTTTVTLNANAPDGETVTGGGTTVTATYDATLPSFSALTCTGGYALKGYYDATSIGNKIINADGSFNGNSGIWNRTDGSTLTLYAQWSLDRTLTYDDNGSTGGSVPASPTNYSNGASATVLGNTNSLVKTGYTFTGWNTSADGNGTPYSAGNSITMNANYTLYAQWSENMTTVNLIASPTGRGTFTVGGSTVTSTTAGVTTTRSVTAEPITGYYLTGTIWSKNNNNISLSTTTSATTTVTGGGTAETSTDLTATFKEKYLLCGSVNAAGDPSGGMRGWSTTGNNDSYNSVTYSGSTITIQANLTQAGTQYKCMIRDVQNSAWKGQTSAGGSMSDGDTWTWNGTNDVLFTTTEAGIYTFTINISGASPSVQLTYPGETEYSATLSVHSSGHGSVSPAAGSIILHPYSTTSITATPEAGYRFKQWNTTGSVTCSNSTSATATFTASAAGGTIEAEFTNDGIVYLDKSAIKSSWSGTPYVYFYSGSYWDASKGSGSHNILSGPHAMTQIGNSQIWYYDYSSTPGTGSTKNVIAFNDHSQAGYDNFAGCQAMYRSDFYQKQNMFVVKDYKSYYNTSAAAGQAVYYNEGYWRKYNETDPGYVIKTYNGFGVGSTCTGTYRLSSTELGGRNCTVDVPLNSGANYFKVVGCDTTTINGISYTGTYYRDSRNGTMSTDNCTNWLLTNASGSNTGVEATASADYKFTLTLGEGSLLISVDFPMAVGDYRLVYNGKMQTTAGSKKDHPSNFFRKLKQPVVASDTTKIDTISFFVDPANSPTIRFQYCSAIAVYTVTWTNFDNDQKIDLTGITKAGVYDFVITQTNSKRTGVYHQITGVLKGAYDGNYYIRTNAAAGGWKSYQATKDNQMVYTYLSKQNSGYDYYYCNWVLRDGNVKFTIANDHSECISDTLENDSYVTRTGADAGKLSSDANVRFMYNDSTNFIGRAYINGSTYQNRYLVLTGDAKTFDENGNSIAAHDDLLANELEFDDKGNWVYQTDLRAQSGSKVSVTAKYMDRTQTFIDNQTLITSTDESTKYLLRAVYDFKTNQLIAAWLPDNTITQNMDVTADVMLIRSGQGAANQIKFSGSQVITDVKKIIGAIEFRKDSIVGRVGSFSTDVIGASGNRTYREMMLYISFPFDVAVHDIFGIGELNKEWYLQYYDGAERASKGFFRGDGTTTFWKFMNINDTLRANVGYSLLLDNDYFNTDGQGVWKNIPAHGKVYLYFPSTSELGTSKVIKSGSAPIDVPSNLCEIDRPFNSENAGKEVNHTFTDSHWNMIGVPIFENQTSMETSKFSATLKEDLSEALETDHGYFYEWDSLRNAYNIHTTSGYTFKSMHGYMVQFSGTIGFTGSSIQPSSIVAARRMPQTDDYMIELQMLFNNEQIGHTYVELREQACDTFALNEDVYMIPTARAADIFTFAGNYDVAANVLPIANRIVEVGVNVRQAGTYTFSMPSNFSGEAVLVDAITGKRTKLAMSDYSVELEKGYTGRFTLEINVNKTPTAIDGVEGEGSLKDGKAHKFLQEGLMYILQNGVMYDAQGRRVK
ncbi:MAG: InlB B-repeat-containing protein [Paludibacteraceae bacterium]|nr:InlB B-repeat-containing protein [Paludibacteraceae bacterium]